jgi:hypothetical protein
MVEVYGYDVARIDIDFMVYLDQRDNIDALIDVSGNKYWFVGREVVEGNEVAVFLFPTANGNQRVLKLAESITALLDQVVA